MCAGAGMDIALYDKMKDMYDLPELEYVRLYCVGARKSLADIYSSRLDSDICGLQNIKKNFSRLYLGARADMFLDLLRGERFSYSPETDTIAGVMSVAKKYGCNGELVRSTYVKAIRLLRSQQNLFMYTSDLVPVEASGDVASLGLKTLYYYALMRAGITNVSQLVEKLSGCKSPEEVYSRLQRVRNLGKNGSKELYDVLHSRCLI